MDSLNICALGFRILSINKCSEEVYVRVLLHFRQSKFPKHSHLSEGTLPWGDAAGLRFTHPNVRSQRHPRVSTPPPVALQCSHAYSPFSALHRITEYTRSPKTQLLGVYRRKMLLYIILNATSHSQCYFCVFYNIRAANLTGTAVHSFTP